LAGSAELHTTVHPFILRGVNLLGMDSLRVPNVRRREIWQRLRQDLPLDKLEQTIRLVPMSQLPGLAPDILAGKVRGRTVVDVNA
jgi:acrylyl-CoA reductase (NADPH)